MARINTSPAPALTPRQSQLTRQAQRLVGQTFYGTLLKQMHNSPFKSKILDGGRGAEAFAPLMDQRLIDRMSKSAGKRLVQSIVRHIEHRQVGAVRTAESMTPATGDFRDGAQSHSGSPDRKPPSAGSLRSRVPALMGNRSIEMRFHVPDGLRA